MPPKKQHPKTRCQSGFGLIEILISIGILVTVFSGIIYGYVQANRMSEWSSMSLAAQSYASEGAEQVRAGNWSPRAWPPVDQTTLTNYSFKDIMDQYGFFFFCDELHCRHQLFRKSAGPSNPL